MCALRRAYEPLDSLLLAGSSFCPSGLLPYTARVPSIERDLTVLALGLENLNADAPDVNLAPPASAAAYLGVRYVVEGAQIGSRFIYHHLRSRFGDDLREFGTFWMSASDAPGCWTGVLQSLADLDSRESVAVAARAARTVFRHMGSCLIVNGQVAAW